MDIKLAEQSRVAQYGIALGVLLHEVWRGLVRLSAGTYSSTSSK